MSDVTRVLSAIESGDPQAAEQLLTHHQYLAYEQMIIIDSPFLLATLKHRTRR